MIKITTKFDKDAVMARPEPKEPTLHDAIEGAINNCAKAINTLESRSIEARKQMCDLLTLKEELLNDKISSTAQKFLFNLLEDNL